MLQRSPSNTFDNLDGLVSEIVLHARTPAPVKIGGGFRPMTTVERLVDSLRDIEHTFTYEEIAKATGAEIGEVRAAFDLFSR